LIEQLAGGSEITRELQQRCYGYQGLKSPDHNAWSKSITSIYQFNKKEYLLLLLKPHTVKPCRVQHN
jgi:hypothetical protein